MSDMNRLYNCKNPYQGNSKKVLCVCSAGLLRSPTTALVLAQEPYNYNTRAVGLHDYALIPIDDVLIEWADEIVVMDKGQKSLILDRFKTTKPIKVLEIPDNFEYRNDDLIKLIKERYPKCKTDSTK